MIADVLVYDLSRYQGIEAVQPQAVIFNVDDPGFPDKVRRALDLGIPWDFYPWVHPGEDFSGHVARSWDRAAPLIDGRAPWAWFDYEETGVEPWQLSAGFARTDEFGVSAGYYALASAPGIHDLFAARSYWCCQYPGGNDGTFPGLGRLLAPRPVQLWQFTSSANGPGPGLDISVVVDDAWYPTWVSSPSRGDDVIFKAVGNSTTNPAVTDGSTWVEFLGALVAADPANYPGVGVVPVDGEFMGKRSIASGKGDAGQAPAVDLAPLTAALTALSQDLGNAQAHVDAARAALP